MSALTMVILVNVALGLSAILVVGYSMFLAGRAATEEPLPEARMGEERAPSQQRQAA
jgi:hypothetical protein